MRNTTYFPIILAIVFSFLTFSCKKDTVLEQGQYVYVDGKLVRLANITTKEVSDVTSSTAVCGGNVISSGGANVTERGVCWGTSQNPTINNNKIPKGSGLGEFICAITGLTQGHTYYVRAYAINSVGIAYGEEKSFVAMNVTPTVTTNSVSNITQTSAVCGGNVTFSGQSNVTARGVCWSTTQNPTVNGSHTTNGSGTGSFTSNITGLSPNTTYYVKAYATNSQGTSYGLQCTFTTTATSNCPSTVTDYDGNTYSTVQIGSQCWMKQNLRTTHYANGTSIALGSSASTTTAYRYYPKNNSSNVSDYGYLYNWKVVMRNSSSSSANPSGVQGVCPNGWHVPSDAEWTQLTDYLSSQTQYQCGSSSTKIAKALASTSGWYSSSITCAVGNAPISNNSTGFSVLPAGDYNNGNYNNFGCDAWFFSTTEYNDKAYGRHLGYDGAFVGIMCDKKSNGFSVRCVRD